MRRKTRRFLNKNDPSTVTFNLVSVSQDDPRNIYARQKHSQTVSDPDNHTVSFDYSSPAVTAFKRFIPRNVAKKGNVRRDLPESVLNVLQPEDFGIHANLPEAALETLTEEVYGISLRADIIKEQIKNTNSYHTETPVSFNEDNINFECLETADCYFPLDGYNYEQHLRPIRSNIICPIENTTPLNNVNSSISMQTPIGGVSTVAASCTIEEKEALEALSDADEYEPLPDDFLTTVLEGVDEKELLWGKTQCKDEFFTFHTNAEKLEIQRLLNESRHLSDSEDEYGDFLNTQILAQSVTDLKLKQILDDEYCEDEIGELVEELPLNATSLNEYHTVLNDFLIKQDKQKIYPATGVSEKTGLEGHILLNRDAEDIITPLDAEEMKKILFIAENNTTNDVDENSEEEEEEEEQKDCWDCETILTTRSNLYNHPQRINRPILHSKLSPSIPATLSNIFHAKTVDTVLQAVSISKRTDDDNDTDRLPTVNEEPTPSNADSDELLQLPPIITKREKNETSEEKRARKSAVKQARRIIREVKKKNAEIIKDEEQLQKNKTSKKNVYDVQDGVRRFRL